MTFEVHMGHRAHSEDVHRRIFQSHLAYLNQEETPAKLKQRHNLDALIVEFLSLVPHSEKFSSAGVENVLSLSIHENPNFSAYKAASAFEALEKYATNLLSHPWRKEYKVVKLYSGFYKHSVESQLFGGGTIFHLLGYKQSDNSVFYLDEPVDPDKVARVALDCLKAYVECHIMLQICEKVKTFKCSWSEILKVRQEYVCGIDEAVRILQLLKRTALEQIKQEKWLKSKENVVGKDQHLSGFDSSRNNSKVDILVDISNTWPSNNAPQVSFSDGILIPESSHCNHSVTSKSANKAIHSHSKLPSWSEGVTYKSFNYPGGSLKPENSDDFLIGTYSNQNRHDYSSLSGSKSMITADDITHNTSLVSDRDGSWDVFHTPLHKPLYPNNLHQYNIVDQSNHKVNYSSVPNMKLPYAAQYPNVFPSTQMLSGNLSSFTCPQSSGLSSQPCHPMCCEQHFPVAPNMHFKDIHRHNPLENSCITPAKNPSSMPLDLNTALYQLSLNRHNHIPKTGPLSFDELACSSHQVTNHGLEGSMRVDSCTNSNNKAQQSSKRGSFYDNVTEHDVNTTFSYPTSSLFINSELQANGLVNLSMPVAPGRPKNKKPVSSESTNIMLLKKNASQKEISSTQEEKSISSASNDSKVTKYHTSATHRNPKEGKRWSCTSCTYYNSPEKSICDMCGRSKFPGPESTPLVSGGRECPQCTLVNKKESEDCTACGASLKDSPTYI